MLRFDVLEPRDTPAVVLDLAFDPSAGAVALPDGAIRLRELPAPAPANDTVLLARDASGAVVIFSGGGLYGRVALPGSEVLVYLGHRFAVGGATAAEVDVGSGDDLVVNATGLPATLSGGAGHDLLIGGTAADVLDGGAGSDILAGRGGGDYYLAPGREPDLVLPIR